MIKRYWKFINESISHKEIERICKEYKIENYTINEDGVVDVDGDVHLSRMSLTELPIRFGKVGGDFNCDRNDLTSLKGSPSMVGGDFNCYTNKLSSLKGSPSNVGGDFHCWDNVLRTLEGGPSSVGGSYHCCGNILITLEGFPELYGNNMYVDISMNPVYEVYLLFNDVKAITLMNEWEVIDPVSIGVSYLRLCEVYEGLGMVVPDRGKLAFENYTLVD
jgi:hypothetical protein